MISLRQVKAHPQVLSTNRHILQGWVECPLGSRHWNGILSGEASDIGGEPFEIVVANHGVNAKAPTLEAVGSEAKLAAPPIAGLNRLTLSPPANSEVKWSLRYK